MQFVCDRYKLGYDVRSRKQNTNRRQQQSYIKMCVQCSNTQTIVQSTLIKTQFSHTESLFSIQLLYLPQKCIQNLMPSKETPEWISPPRIAPRLFSFDLLVSLFPKVNYLKYGDFCKINSKLNRIDICGSREKQQTKVGCTVTKQPSRCNNGQ